jgi:hypothetical protein
VWNAPSDLDYYGQSGFSGEEPEEEREVEPQPTEDDELGEEEIEPEPPEEEQGEQQ